MRRTGSRRPAVVMALLGLVVTAGLSADSLPSRRPVAPATASPAHDVLASLPLAFEPAGDDGFVSRGPGYTLSLRRAEAAFAVAGGSFTMRPAGPSANAATQLMGGDLLPGTVSRLQGDDAASWRAGLPTYGSVVARELWPGVDMVWHGNQRLLEHDMVVASGVDPSVVAFDLDGAVGLTIDARGDLVVDLGGATTRMAAPVLYQDAAGGRRRVSGGFDLLGGSKVGFRVGDYDRTLPLVIDPTLVTSTYLGGNGADNGYGIARDRAGNTYLVGATESTDFPTGSPVQPSLSASAAGGPGSDVFVAKVNSTGSGLVWSTYLGGRGRDTGYGIAVGQDGAVYVTGVTESTDFPRIRAAQENYGGGPSDAFVAKLSTSGSSLEWSTFLGGTQTDQARGLAVDPAGNAYVTGSTSSVDFPAVAPQQPGPFRPDDVDAFVAKIPSAGAPVAFSTRLGGSNDDHGLSIAVDAQGSAYVTGDTLSPGFPTVRPFQAGSGGSASGVAGSFPDAFVAKYTPPGNALVYSTFLGGSDFDQGTAIAVDGTGAAYLTGNTNSPNFPTAAPFQARKDGDSDAFVSKLDPTGAALVFSSYYGGAGADGGNGVALDGTSMVVAGTTASANLAMTRPTQSTRSGGSDGFVLKLNTTGNAAVFSSFVGGRDEDQAMAVASGAQGEVVVIGFTSSADFPTAKPLQAARAASNADVFLSSLSLADTAAQATPTTPASASSTGHDRRVRALGILTIVLLLAAVLQTVYLRRRTPAIVSDPPPRPRPVARPGLNVLADDTGVMAGTGAKAGGAGVATKAGGAGGAKAGSGKGGRAKSNRTPKARGGPKGQPSATRPPKGADAPSPGSIAVPLLADDDSGPPTVAAPPVAVTPPKAPLQEPAIAQLLEEDIRRTEPASAKPPPHGNWDRLADDRSGEVEVIRTAGPELQIPPPAAPTSSAAPAPPPPPPQPSHAIPPLPAEDLSFWDLFPEDLPPARSGGFQVDDIVDNAALPPAAALSPDQRSAAKEPLPPRPPASPPPPEAEIVIAELLDGPVPLTRRIEEDRQWAPEPGGTDFLISDLLSEEPEDGGEDGAGDGAAPPAGGGRSPEEQARIAADRARRRRNSRRGGSRPRRPGPGSSGSRE